jgi:hypothetical protein
MQKWTAQSQSTSQGVIRWQTQPGMGYQLQRTMEVGGTMAPQSWISIPNVRYYGTGAELWHRCFELALPTSSPTGAAALAQLISYRPVTITARRDGAAVVTWTYQGQAVTAYIQGPPPGTAQVVASASPYLDFRTTPGVAWHQTNNLIRLGNRTGPSMSRMVEDRPGLRIAPLFVP